MKLLLSGKTIYFYHIITGLVETMSAIADTNAIVAAATKEKVMYASLKCKFDNWHMCNIRLFGITFQNVEQAFTFVKVFLFFYGPTDKEKADKRRLQLLALILPELQGRDDLIITPEDIEGINISSDPAIAKDQGGRGGLVNYFDNDIWISEVTLNGEIYELRFIVLLIIKLAKVESNPEIGNELDATDADELVEFATLDPIWGTSLVTFIKDGILMQLEFNLVENHWHYRPVGSSPEVKWIMLDTGLLRSNSLQDLKYDGANMAGRVWMLIRKMRLNAQI